MSKVSEPHGVFSTLMPSEVRFTREFIAPRFKDGLEISHTALSIATGRQAIEPYEPLKVFRRDGGWYTWYNQKLYMMRLLEQQEFLDFVVVREVKEKSTKDDRQMTTRNGGSTVLFRYEEIFPHGPIIELPEVTDDPTQLPDDDVTSCSVTADVGETTMDERPMIRIAQIYEELEKKNDEQIDLEGQQPNDETICDVTPNTAEATSDKISDANNEMWNSGPLVPFNDQLEDAPDFPPALEITEAERVLTSRLASVLAGNDDNMPIDEAETFVLVLLLSILIQLIIIMIV